MVSKSTKSIASRIPFDLYFHLKKEADDLELNMKDYLLKIIIERNTKKVLEVSEEKPKIEKVKKTKSSKKIKNKQESLETGTLKLDFDL
jgi:hypothetical protein